MASLACVAISLVAFKALALKDSFLQNTIAPGALETKMMAATLEAGREAILEAIPLARIGTPEDVAGTCLYLASRAGAWTNGAVIALDGGTVVAGKL